MRVSIALKVFGGGSIFWNCYGISSESEVIIFYTKKNSRNRSVVDTSFFTRGGRSLDSLCDIIDETFDIRVPLVRHTRHDGLHHHVLCENGLLQQLYHKARESKPKDNGPETSLLS